ARIPGRREDAGPARLSVGVGDDLVGPPRAQPPAEVDDGAAVLAVLDAAVREPAVLSEVPDVEVDHPHPRARVDEDLAVRHLAEARAVAVAHDEVRDAAQLAERAQGGLVVAAERRDLLAEELGQPAQPLAP